MTEENRKGIPVKAMALEKITIPVFIVAHQDDKCWVTQPLMQHNNGIKGNGKKPPRLMSSAMRELK
jgi:hypothetical protein